MKRFAAIVLAALFVCGCAGKRPPPAPPPAAAAGEAAVPPRPQRPFFLAWMNLVEKVIPPRKRPPQAVPPRWIGEVKMVNAPEHFVLIDAVAISYALPGEELACISEHRETARLRLSPLKSPPFLIADIISGKPSVGDRVCKP